MSKLASCTHDNNWDECEWIGTMTDGFPLYSHCKKNGEFLKSCFVLTGTGGESTSDYEF